MQELVPDVSSTNAVKFDGERDNSVNHYLSDSLILIKKLDSQAENIKELSGKIELLTCYVQSQNKFLNDIISVVKSLVLEKSLYDWEAFVKREKKCMLKLGNHQLNFAKDLATSVEEKINASTPYALYRAGPFLVTTPLSDDDLHVLCYALGDNLDKKL